MAKKRIILELGQGTSLRNENYTRAAKRAVENALWQNSLSVAELFGFEKKDMVIDVVLGSQEPTKIDRKIIEAIFPYGEVSIKCIFGGLDVPTANASRKTLIVTAAIIVSLEMEVVA